MALALLAAAWLSPRAILAQQLQGGLRLNQYVPAPTAEDGLAVELPQTLGSGRVSFQIIGDYAHNPLTLHQGNASDLEEVGSIVDQQITGSLTGAVGLGDRLQLWFVFPLILSQSGESPSLTGIEFAEPESFALADPSIGASAWAVGQRGGVFHLGFSASAQLPVGSEDDFGSDGSFGARGRMLTALSFGPLTIAANAGVAYRDEIDFDVLRLGSQFLFDGGFFLRAAKGMQISLELFGNTGLRGNQGSGTTNVASAFSPKVTPLEALLGFRYNHSSGFTLGAGASVGATKAAGTPDVRGIATLGFTSPLHETREEPILEPEPEPEGPADRDNDGILDPDDACPSEPEDRDDFEDDNGCPDPDNDEDQVLDGADQCPNEPEDRDQFEDENGCPDPDNDNDGIPDASDQCPTDPESMNGVEDTDGCPELARVVGDQIEIRQRIEFRTGRAVLQASATAILQEVASLFTAHTEITLVRVEGHTDSRGADARNMDLSRRRAETVKTWLTEHGIDASRLSAEGFGETRPLENNRTAAGRRANRRVEFHIVQRRTP